ncbi:MAG: phage tail sheath family protein [Bacteroidia bacterium]|nr:phage tail sheath family protein [Bacteroidia bacterium]
MTYKTPGVYVEEISKLPPSVAEVSTAIPAFIGYTQLSPGETVTETLAVKTPGATETFILSRRPIYGNSLSALKLTGAVTAAAGYDKASRTLTVDTTGKKAGDLFTVTYSAPRATRINTFLEFQNMFGGPKPMDFNVETNATGSAILSLEPASQPTFSLYYNLDMFFRNGGSTCYIVSVGDYSGSLDKDDLSNGLDALRLEDEPTLIIQSDAVNLPEPDYYTLCVAALTQCADTQDRFTIFDVKDSDLDASRFRGGVVSPYLNYGAAYFPYLFTSLTYQFRENGVNIKGLAGQVRSYSTGTDQIKVNYNGPKAAPAVKLIGTPESGKNQGELSFTFNTALDTLTINGVAVDANTKHTGQEIADAWTTFKAASNETNGFDIVIDGSGTAPIVNTGNTTYALQGAINTLADLKNTHTGLYNQIKTELANQRVVLPPSGAMAGVYAQVDRDRGVWKAPANVGIAAVIAPSVKITNKMQDDLNVDATSGKSVNAIRSFPGKGTLVWGSRTLAGNDNEWRYVPVRRLFIMIEESVKKASAFAVFEPNDANTWLKVRAMIESFLYSLWQKGAMAGATAEDAYFVNVGLGTTMTPQDILEGRMNVEIGIAAVRPAEFIILKFSHKLQE